MKPEDDNGKMRDGIMKKRELNYATTNVLVGDDIKKSRAKMPVDSDSMRRIPIFGDAKFNFEVKIETVARAHNFCYVVGYGFCLIFFGLDN